MLHLSPPSQCFSASRARERPWPCSKRGDRGMQLVIQVGHLRISQSCSHSHNGCQVGTRRRSVTTCATCIQAAHFPPIPTLTCSASLRTLVLLHLPLNRFTTAPPLTMETDNEHLHPLIPKDEGAYSPAPTSPRRRRQPVPSRLAVAAFTLLLLAGLVVIFGNKIRMEEKIPTQLKACRTSETVTITAPRTSAPLLALACD